MTRSLKDSADRNKQRGAEPYRSAMSMLVLNINRAGRNLPEDRRAVLEQAKDELRKLYGKTTTAETKTRATPVHRPR